MRFPLRLFLLFWPFTFLCTGVPAQNITGVVTDSLTGDPVSFATVYLDGTSKGAVTADDGTFTITNPILPAKLVVSHLSYENKSMAMTTANQPLRIILIPAKNILTSISVEDRNRRAGNLADFRRYLIGTDKWGAGSKIANEDDIRFDRDYAPVIVEVRTEGMRDVLKNRKDPSGVWSADGKTYTREKALNLKATSQAALKLSLPHLGYTCSFDLNVFQLSYKSRLMSYLGSFYFQPVEKVTKRHLKNRERAYCGSSMHFLRALVADSLLENGFRVWEIARDPRSGAEIMLKRKLANHLARQTDGTYTLSGLAGRKFSILYYADGKSRPLPVEKHARAQPIPSRLDVNGDRCLLLPGGVCGDLNMIFHGNMGSRALAWSLPADYVVGE